MIDSPSLVFDGHISDTRRINSTNGEGASDCSLNHMIALWQRSFILCREEPEIVAEVMDFKFISRCVVQSDFPVVS